MGKVMLSPYIPVRYLEQTEFPEAFGADVKFQIKVNEEKWARFYPKIPYYSLFQNTGVIETADTVTPEIPAPVAPSDAGAAAFDPLWGETIDPAAAAAGQWSQPHLSGTQDATTELEGYAAPVDVHIQIQGVTNKKRTKEQWGFDDVRDIIGVVPLSLLDRCGIGVKEGDKFIWDGAEYSVLEFRGSGFWKNSNVRLFGAMALEHKRLGS